MLDGDYRPVATPDRKPVRPRFPTRVRAFSYACALVAAQLDGLTGDKSQPRPRPNRAQRRGKR